MNEIQAAYPQCANCLYHFKSQKLLMNHMRGGVFTAKDVVSKAMKHADELLSRMDFTLEGAIDQASNMFDNAINNANIRAKLLCWLGPHQKGHASRVDFQGNDHYSSVLESWGVY